MSVSFHVFAELSDKAWGRSKKTFYAVEGERDCASYSNCRP